MELIKTDSFQIAAFTRGNKESNKLAILLPGRLDTKDYANFASHAEYLANRNFFVVAIDPPGTWESPGGIELFTTTNYIKTVNELITHFGNKPTILLGHSRGGSTAIIAAVSNPAIVGVITLMPNIGAPTVVKGESLKKGYQESLRDLPPGTSRTEESKKFNLPLAYWEDGKKYNPAETLKTLTKPKFIIYGTDDEFVSADLIKDLYKDIPEPKMIMEVNSVHDYRYHPELFEEINNNIGEFLDTYKI